MTDNPEQPSAEALRIARNVLGPYANDGGAVTIAQSVALALDRFRAAGVREERERGQTLRTAWHETVAVSDEEWEHCIRVMDNPQGPTPTLIAGQALLARSTARAVDNPEQPSAEALALAEKWRNRGWGDARFAEFVADLDRFRAAGVREAYERCSICGPEHLRQTRGKSP